MHYCCMKVIIDHIASSKYSIIVVIIIRDMVHPLSSKPYPSDIFPSVG